METSAAAQERIPSVTADAVGLNIRMRRTALRMRQQELAMVAGISVGHLCKDRGRTASPTPVRAGRDRARPRRRAVIAAGT